MKVLIIEDNPDHLDLIIDALDSIKEVRVLTQSVLTMAEGIDLFHDESFDVCLCDLQLPDSTVEQTVKQLSSDSFPIPIIVLSSLNSLEIAKSLLNKGVQDYLPKDEISPALLFRSCRYAIERWNRQQEIENHNQYMQVFCSSLSHDFNGQISLILTLVELLKGDLCKRVQLTKDEVEIFNFLTSSTTKINHLVSALQNYLSVEYSDKNLVPVVLADVIKNVSDTLKDTIEKDFVIDIQTGFPNIQGNPALLHLLFHNLINNAIKFNENAAKVVISYMTDEQQIHISVQDNGIGIDAIFLDSIFAPFKRLKKNSYKGTGLGLSIVKRVVEQHMGNIAVTSEVGEGTTFTISLPLE